MEGVSVKVFCVKECVYIYVCVCSLPCLCGKQLVVVGGALVIILSVSDDRGKALTDQSLCYVTGESGERDREITLIKTVISWPHSEF